MEVGGGSVPGLDAPSSRSRDWLYATRSSAVSRATGVSHSLAWSRQNATAFVCSATARLRANQRASAACHA